MIEKEEPVISEEEAAQYDRQIRLWGLEAQKRLRGSRVLLAGLGGLGAEVAKNLILAGVKGLTLLDHEQVSEESCRAQFLVPVAGSLGQNRAQASLERAQNLNPMVQVHADPGHIQDKPDEFFLQFDAVVLTRCSRDLLLRLDQLCSHNNIKVFCGDVYGYYGYAFANLGQQYGYVEEKPKVVKPSADSDGPDSKKTKVDPTETTMVKKVVSFCSLKQALDLDWTSDKAKAGLKKTPSDYFLLQVMLKFRTDRGADPEPGSFEEHSSALRTIRDDVMDKLGVSKNLLDDQFSSFCFSELSPVCAVVGGVLGQEVVKALSHRDPPHRNFFFFDARKGSGVVDYFGPNSD